MPINRWPVGRGLALASLMFFGLSGCGFGEKDPDQAVDCAISAMSENQRLLEGAASLSGPSSRLSLSVKASCAPKALWSASAAAELHNKVGQRLAQDKHYKAGQYTALLGAPPKPASTAALFPFYLERTAQVRTAMLRCIPESQTAIANVAELDLVFTMAVLYRQGYAHSAADANALAGRLINAVAEKAKEQAPLPCGEPLSAEFRLLGEDSVAFYKGEHPWAPHCRPEVSATEVSLKCEELQP